MLNKTTYVIIKSSNEIKTKELWKIFGYKKTINAGVFPDELNEDIKEFDDKKDALNYHLPESQIYKIDRFKHGVIYYFVEERHLEFEDDEWIPYDWIPLTDAPDIVLDEDGNFQIN